MSGTPAFASTPITAAAAVSSANTGRDGSGTIVTIYTAPANGVKIEEIRIKADADPADSVVVIYLHDGTSYFVFDEFDIDNPAAASNTVGAYGMSRVYENLILENGWSIRASITVAPTSGEINVFCFG